ncbi:laminin subunit beta-3 [Kryptolebias marmoratus]|uniref:Laminin subunit beta 3 n=1 Tax=Kryptolebias marmoratus TaxID=37003 RepID=A0A3Q3B6R2_KRYMA|nr:laminin subunit beta-3 [Kryptolebias marmoratus]
MRILVLVAAIAAVSQAQNDCSRGACYPPIGDLLLGRSYLLRASSTCGLTGSEVYCTPYQQWRMKCCPCDSRNPNGQLAHTVQEVLATSGPDRWWQSKKGVNPVTLQFDLNSLFQLDNLLLNFKGPRPQAMVIERSVNNGQTWEPALYLATDCQKAFPGVPTTMPLTLDQTYCHTLPLHSDLYQDERIEFSPLRQYLAALAPNSQKLEERSGFTGLRVRMTELGEVPHLPGRSLSRFYALKEMRVMGSCMCHGHANRCLPEEYNNALSNTIQVNPQCDCRHNTVGVNCERCADLYNDLPWRSAEERNTHACKRCECNNHAQRCRFDLQVYEASGRTSGGVCEGCMHHTTGPKCDQCAPGYQPNPRSRMDRPDACIRCICSAEGTVNGGQCEDSSGSCQCKVNVEALRCDRCKRGYYGLSQSNPLGCSRCSCSPDGSMSDVCDPLTGQCPCRPHFHGRTCDVCSKGYWKPFLSTRCEPCGCEPTTSNSDTCDQLTGQCECRPGFGGRTCSDCPDNTYGNPFIRCQPCQCDAEGTLPGVCDKQTGACLCRPGVTGSRCDLCRPGHCYSFPACELCPSCFFTLDSQRKNISLTLEKLILRFPTVPGGDGNFGSRIQVLEASLKQIRDSISRPPNTITPFDDALFQLVKLRDDLDKVDNDLPAIVETPDLESKLNELQALLDSLALIYKVKKDAVENSTDPNNSGAFTTIKNAYKNSTDAAKKVTTATNKVEEATDLREQTKDIQSRVQETNIRDLNQLNQSMALQPDLTPAAKQVCGSVRSEPCTPLQCEAGDLCPPEGTPPCEKGTNCVGALPLSNKANADVNNVKDRLNKLSAKMTEAAEMLQKTQETTNQVRQSTMDLSNNMKEARDQLEEELNETRNIVKELKDFLSDPSSNLTQIKDVSDWILNAKLPLSLDTLKKKLEELKNLAANLPNSTAVLKEAEPQLETAKKLLQEAQDARDKALGVRANVSRLDEVLESSDDALSDLEKRLQESMSSTENLTETLTQVKNQLSPAEKALDDVSALLKPMKSQLGDLKELLKNGLQKAEDAEKNADKANEDAAAANQDLLTLEKQFNDLKDKGTTGGGGEAGPIADRLAKLQDSAGTLANTTENMMNALEGKADSLQKLQNEILEKSEKLKGLDTKLKDLLAKIQDKAKILNSCQA